MSLKLAEAFVEIKGDMSKYHSDIRRARSVTDSFVRGLSGSLMGITKALAGITAAAVATAGALTALAIKSTKDFAMFGNEMARVSTMIKTNWRSTTKVLSDGVRQLSTEIPQTTKELSEALFDILSASVPVSKSMMTLEVAGKAAVAGMSTVQTAANLLTGTINGLGLSFDDMGMVSDLAFSTVREGKLTFEELAFSIGRAIPSVNKMNGSIQELFGSMAFLTKNALSSEMAATALASAYELFASKADKLGDIGVRVFGDSGEFLGILRIVEQMRDAIGGLTEEAQTNVLESMGIDRRSGRALVTMIKNFEGFQRTMANVQNSAGATADAFEKMQETLVTQWRTMKNSFSNLFIVIGSGFADMASGGIKAVKEMVDGITTIITGAGGISKLWEQHREAVTATFKDIATSSIVIMGAMLSALGTLIASGAKLIWQPMKSEGKRWWMELMGAIDMQMAEWTSNIADGTKEGMERRDNAIKSAIAKWHGARKEHEEESARELKRIVGEVTDDLAAKWINLADTASVEFGKMGGSIAGLNEEVFRLRNEFIALAEAAGELKEFPKDLFEEIGILPHIELPEFPEDLFDVTGIVSRVELTAAAFRDLVKAAGELTAFPEDLFAETGVRTPEEQEAHAEKVRTIWEEYFQQRRERFEGDQDALADYTQRQEESWNSLVAIYKKALDQIFDAQDEAAKKEKKLRDGQINFVRDWLDDLFDAQKEQREKNAALGKEFIDSAKQDIGAFVDAFKSPLENLFVNLFDAKVKDKWEQFWKDMGSVAISQLARIATEGIFGLLKAGGKKLFNIEGADDEVLSLSDKLGLLTGSANSVDISMRNAASAIREFSAAASEAELINVLTLSLDEPKKLAAGGIVTKPTLAVIGEAGPEAVIPLVNGKVPVEGGASMGGRSIIINASFPHADIRNITREELSIIADKLADAQMSRQSMGLTG